MQKMANRVWTGKGKYFIFLMSALFAIVSSPGPLWAGDNQEAETMIKNACSSCHKFQGEGQSRFNLKGPDLMWAGSKFQKEWMVGWLTGKEPTMYVKGYRWDQSQQTVPHMTVSHQEAEALAEYIDTHFQDPRVKKNAIEMSTFSKQEAKFGKEIFTQHSCIGCHQISLNGEKTGGPQSASFFDSGRRLKADWIYRFNSSPPDFVPHSGEFVGDVSALGLRYVTGFIATRGANDFPFFEPWKSAEFDHPSVERGKVVYKEYCSQCHGPDGNGDGPAASGLSPKPAAHSKMDFEKIPTEYLYNVIYYGGRSVGKSPNMPYWGLTIGQQGVADVMAFLKVTFKGVPQLAEANVGEGPSGVCPQPRKTVRAPGKFRRMQNPLPSNEDNIKAGETLFQQTGQPIACMNCHGPKGDGHGPMGAALSPPPRNFTCGETMSTIADGQLYWVIKKGSVGTGMMAFPGLSDNQIWQLILYIRTLSK